MWTQLSRCRAVLSNRAGAALLVAAACVLTHLQTLHTGFHQR